MTSLFSDLFDKHGRILPLKKRRADFGTNRNHSDAYNKNDDFGASYIPTPEEIKEACAEIRKGWSPAEREKRTAASHRSQQVITQEIVIQLSDTSFNDYNS